MDIASNATHANSRREFLGRNPSAAEAARFSAERRLSNATPPTLIVHAKDDQIVPSHGSQLYWTACYATSVPCTLVTLKSGGHPFVTKPYAWDTAKAATDLWLRTFSNFARPHSTRPWRPLPPSVNALSMNSLRQKLIRLPHVAGVQDTVVERFMSMSRSSGVVEAAKPTRPPPWVVETFDDPRPGDGQPY